MSKKKINPHCPVGGCETKQPHTDDPLIKALVARFAAPDKCLSWVQGSLTEFHDSMVEDYNQGRHVAWMTRLRQVEELYFRTLYVLFLSTPEETPHILSGDLPNSFSFIYKRVNEDILMGRGELASKKRGLQFGQFTPMDILNSGAHVSYKTMQMVVLIAQYSTFDINGYLKHLQTYITYIDHLRKLFEAGRDKQTVRQVITNMHTPIEEWQRRAREQAAKASAANNP